MHEAIQFWPVILAFDLGRYLVAAGATFFVFWVWYESSFRHRRIQKKVPKRSRLWFEFRYSMLTALIFSGVGVLVFMGKKAGIFHVYENIADLGWAYFVVSIVAAIVIHDAYFYWTHRAMHHPALYRRFHKVHHMSTKPSPWAAYSFAPLEAVVEAGIVPFLLLFLPMHDVAIFLFLLFMIGMNVLGHLGIELYPAGWVHRPLLRYANTTTMHDMHHKYFQSNYGLYFNWWDRAFGTMHVEYEDRFDAVTAVPLRRAKRKAEALVPEGRLPG